MAKLLVSEEEATTKTYDRVIDTNGRARAIALQSAAVVDINAL
jgi:hypothetical protein